MHPVLRSTACAIVTSFLTFDPLSSPRRPPSPPIWRCYVWCGFVSVLNAPCNLTCRSWSYVHRKWRAWACSPASQEHGLFRDVMVIHCPPRFRPCVCYAEARYLLHRVHVVHARDHGSTYNHTVWRKQLVLPTENRYCQRHYALSVLEGCHGG